MVELELPKLAVRVRFPSPAPPKAQVTSLPPPRSPPFRAYWSWARRSGEAHARGDAVEDRAAPYVLEAGETRRDDAILPSRPWPPTPAASSACASSGWEGGRRDRYCTATTRSTRPSTWSPAGWRHNWTTGGCRWRPAGSCGCHAGQPTPSPTPDPTR